MNNRQAFIVTDKDNHDSLLQPLIKIFEHANNYIMVNILCTLIYLVLTYILWIKNDKKPTN